MTGDKGAAMTALAAMVRHACPESGPDNERDATAAHDYFAALVQPAKREVDALTAEVRRLRALPVIATCGGCGWRGRATSVNSAHLYCQHPADMPRRIDPDAAPPAWCPMRKGER